MNEFLRHIYREPLTTKEPFSVYLSFSSMAYTVPDKIHVGEIEIHILIVITLFLGTVHGLKPTISMVWLNKTRFSQSHGNTTEDCWF